MNNTYTEHEMAALRQRLERCKTRQCLDSVISDIKAGNGGELPDCFEKYLKLTE